MKAEIRPQPASFQSEVWLYQPGPEGTVIYELDGREREIVERGVAEVKPSFVLPGHVLEAVVAAGSSHLPPSSATERHLKDALEVRDRLLDLLVPGTGEASS